MTGATESSTTPHAPPQTHATPCKHPAPTHSNTKHATPHPPRTLRFLRFSGGLCFTFLAHLLCSLLCFLAQLITTPGVRQRIGELLRHGLYTLDELGSALCVLCGVWCVLWCV